MTERAASKRRALHQHAENEFEVVIKRQKQTTTSFECDVCYETKIEGQVLTLDCKHCVCITCMTRLFSDAIKSESSYPPKCCGEISLTAEVCTLLGANIADRYRIRKEEYGVPPKLRTYCSNTKCGQFVHPRFITEDGIGECWSCSGATCQCCKAEVDTALKHRCMGIAEDKEVISMATAKGCKRCPNCAIFIELQDACNHMCCTFCQYQFCFVCLRKWGSWANGSSHTCPQYNQPLADAEGYIDGFHKDTGFDREGYDRDGFDVRGIDRQGHRNPDIEHNLGRGIRHESDHDRRQREVDEMRFAAQHEFRISERQLEEQYIAEQVRRIEQGNFITVQQLISEIDARLQDDQRDREEDWDQDDSDMASDGNESSEIGELDGDGDDEDGNANRASEPKADEQESTEQEREEEERLSTEIEN